MDAGNVALALLLVAILICVLAVGMAANRRIDSRTAKYPLFHARDALIRRIVEGKLDRNNPDVIFLYDFSNRLINVIRPISLGELLNCFSMNDHSSETADRFRDIVTSDNPHLAKSAHELVKAAMVILLSESIAVRYGIGMMRLQLLGYRIGLGCARVCKHMLNRVSSEQAHAADLYRQLERLA